MKHIENMHQPSAVTPIGANVLCSTTINIVDERQTSKVGSPGELGLMDIGAVYRHPTHFDAVMQQAMARAVSGFPEVEMAFLTATGDPGDEHWLVVYAADDDFQQATELADTVTQLAPIERALDCLPMEVIDRGLASVLSTRSMPFYRRAFGC